jgi:sarcosine oxidase subunit alpha
MAPRDARVEPGPACARGAPIAFRFEGRRVEAFEGETVGAALHADGERVLMRSIKYHRPRGLFCNAGKCASCLARVDGVPNVRACVTPVRAGMVVETQNAFPSARRDLFSVVDKVYRENFDYHQRFIRPKFLAPLYNGVVRRMAGFGKVPDVARARPARPPITRRVVDVAVVGAGPAGLAAAVAAAEGAASVLCVDEADRAGGSLLLHGADGVEAAAHLGERLEDAGGALLERSVAFGLYRTDGVGDALPAPGTLAVLAPTGIVEVRAKTLVVASGYHETPPLFPGNDLPGVMGARAALVLLHRHGVMPGRRVVVTAADALGARAAEDLAKAGAEVVGVAGEGRWKGARVAAATGGTSVASVTMETSGGDRWTEACDLVLAAGGETPRVELLQQAGAPLAWNGRALAAGADAPPVYAAGEVRGALTWREAVADGARAGEAAARGARSS